VLVDISALRATLQTFTSLPNHLMNALALTLSRIGSIVLGSLLLFLTPLWGQALLELEPFDIGKLLVSNRAEEVAQGERLVVEEGSLLIEQLLERIRSESPEKMGEAAEALGVVASPWLRGKEAARLAQLASVAYRNLRPPVRRVPLAEATEIRQTLQSSVSALLKAADGPSSQIHLHTRSLRSLCKTLGEVACDETMDWLIHELQQIASPRLAEPLISLGDSYLSIPPIFRCGMLCGNCTTAEIKAFEESEALAFGEARVTLSQMWVKVRELETRERVAFAIKSWRDAALQRHDLRSHVAANDKWVLWQMEPLVRLGAPALEGLRAQHTVETEESLKMVWEFVIAAITGEREPQLASPPTRRRQLIEAPRLSSPDPGRSPE